MLTSADDVKRYAGLEEMKHIEVWIGTMQLKDADLVCYRERADTWVGVLGGGRKWGRPPRWREGGGCMWVENASCQVASLVSDSYSTLWTAVSESPLSMGRVKSEPD